MIEKDAFLLRIQRFQNIEDLAEYFEEFKEETTTDHQKAFLLEKTIRLH